MFTKINTKTILMFIFTFVIMFVFFNSSSKYVYAGCCNADSDCGTCSNCDAGPDNGQYEWADNYCAKDVNNGPGETCEGYYGDCSTRNCDYHGSCCGNCNPPPPPSKMDIGGFITNNSTGVAIPNVVVSICGSNGSCTNETTGADGSFRNNTSFNQSLNTFSVYIDLSNLPTGYTDAINVYGPNGTDMTNTNRGSACSPTGDTVYGSTGGYQCQTWNNSNSCAQAGGGTGNTRRCNIALSPIATPIVYAPAPACISAPPYNSVTLSWENVSGASNYLLRVNKFNDPAPYPNDYIASAPDWWVIVDKATYCSGALCTFRIPQNVAGNQVLLPGNYNWWKIAPIDSNGNPILTSEATGSAFDINSCYPYSISGSIDLVSDDGTCTLESPSPIDNYADISNLTVEWNTSGYTYSLLEVVNGNSTYSIPNPIAVPGLPGAPGEILLNNGGTSVLQPTGPFNGFITYQPECIQVGSVPPASPSPYQPSVGSANIQVTNNFTSSMTNFNFGYKEVNLFPDGWFASLNGDTYGRDIVNVAIPSSGGGQGGNVQGACEGYLAFGADSGQFDVASFGFNVNINNDSMADSNKFIKNFAGDFWPLDFSFTPSTDPTSPEYAFPITVGTYISDGNLEAGKNYSISDSEINAFLDVNDSYTFSPSSPDGVAVIYVTNQNNAQVFEFNNPNGLVSTNPNQRILFISQDPVFISKEIGVDPADILSGDAQICDINSIDSAPNIQAAIIANQSITVEGDTNDPDKLLIVEGPFVAGSTDNTQNVSILFNRNLGIYNGVYPATIVTYNSLYMKALTEDSGLLISNVTWTIDPDNN